MSRYVIIDDEQEPLRLLMEFGFTSRDNVRGIHVSKTPVIWKQSLRERCLHIDSLDKLCLEIASLSSDVVLLSDLQWDELKQYSQEWREPTNPVRQAVVSFLKRHPLNKFVVYSTHLNAKEVITSIEHESGRTGQCTSLEANFSSRNRNNAGVVTLMRELQMFVGAFSDVYLESIWRSSNRSMFTSNLHCVKHNFKNVDDKVCYLKELQKALQIQIPIAEDTYFNEGFHEAVKNIVGGDSLMASMVAGDPLNIGGVLALAILAFHVERQSLPDWPLKSLTKPIAGRRFVLKEPSMQSFCPIKSRQVGCVLFKAFKHILANEGTELRKPNLLVSRRGFTIELGWNTNDLKEKVNSIAINTPLSLVDNNTACAVSVVNQLLEGQPGKLILEDRHLIIEAD